MGTIELEGVLHCGCATIHMHYFDSIYMHVSFMGRPTAPLACHICAPAQAHHFPRNFRHAESPLSAPDVRKTRGQTYVHTYTYTLDITALDLDMYWQQPASYSPFISKRAQLHIHILSHDNPPPSFIPFHQKKNFTRCVFSSPQGLHSSLQLRPFSR